MAHQKDVYKRQVLALFDDKDNYIMDVEIASHRKHKNFDIVKFKGLYHINLSLIHI